MLSWGPSSNAPQAPGRLSYWILFVFSASHPGACSWGISRCLERTLLKSFGLNSLGSRIWNVLSLHLWWREGAPFPVSDAQELEPDFMRREEEDRSLPSVSWAGQRPQGRAGRGSQSGP